KWVCLYLQPNCENSSVGRARPCQGRGRGFESRFSLYFDKLKIPCPGGGIGRHAGLKILCSLRACGFKSRLGYLEGCYLLMTAFFVFYLLPFLILHSVLPSYICPGKKIKI